MNLVASNRKLNSSALLKMKNQIERTKTTGKAGKIKGLKTDSLNFKAAIKHAHYLQRWQVQSQFHENAGYDTRTISKFVQRTLFDAYEWRQKVQALMNELDITIQNPLIDINQHLLHKVLCEFQKEIVQLDSEDKCKKIKIGNAYKEQSKALMKTFERNMAHGCEAFANIMRHQKGKDYLSSKGTVTKPIATLIREACQSCAERHVGAPFDYEAKYEKDTAVLDYLKLSQDSDAMRNGQFHFPIGVQIDKSGYNDHGIINARINTYRGDDSSLDELLRVL